MKPHRTLLTFSTLALAFGWGTAARADDDLALSFDLPTTVHEDAPVEQPSGAIAPEPPPTVVSADAPIPLPPGAEAPPMSGDTVWPAGVYGGIDAVALGTVESVQNLLPPPPPVTTPVQVAVAPPPTEPEKLPEEADSTPAEAIDRLIGLNLDLQPIAREKPAVKTAAAPSPPAAQPVMSNAKTWDAIQALFEGGTDSLVARAVGSAEGTRTPEGHKNPAYFGHVDPGNGVWNLGTFSYQHGASTPEEADAKQLARLQRQTEVLREKAQSYGLELSQEELLNGIDLANQAPLAALDRGGYIDWLKEAHRLGMTGSDAIVWARTRSFMDPDTQLWNAPGLGNNVYSISHDQERRASAIARAVDASGLITQVTLVAEQPSQPAADAVAETVVAAASSPPLGLDFDMPIDDAFMQPGQMIATAPTPASASAQDAPKTIAANSAQGGSSSKVEFEPVPDALAQFMAPAEATAASQPEAQNDSAPATAELSAVADEVESAKPIQFAEDELAAEVSVSAAEVQAAEVAPAAVQPSTQGTDEALAIAQSSATDQLAKAVPEEPTPEAAVQPAAGEQLSETTSSMAAPLEASAPDLATDPPGAAIAEPASAIAPPVQLEGAATEADATESAAIDSAAAIPEPMLGEEQSADSSERSGTSSVGSELVPPSAFAPPNIFAPTARNTHKTVTKTAPKHDPKRPSDHQPAFAGAATGVVESLNELSATMMDKLPMSSTH